jgi:hypothetical protein
VYHYVIKTKLNPTNVIFVCSRFYFKLLSKILMDIGIKEIQEGFNNMFKRYSKDFANDFTN